MRIIITVALILTSFSFSETATQTDWSGGGGVQGPVTDWGNSYDIAYQINDSGISLQLQWGSLVVPVEHTVDSDYDGARSVYAIDVDGDGDIDVLGAASVAHDITWWENIDGTGTTWTEHTVDDDFNGAYSVYATDVDGDGDTDVLGAAFYANDITWWENTDGTGTSFTEHTVDGDFYGAQSVFATDVDGDGDTDVLGAARNADDITWWENTDGTGTSWTEHTVDGDFDYASSVYAADVDGDGDADVLGTARNAADITWWENTDGTGTSWTEHKVDYCYGAWSVFATDVDGDGDTDVLGAGHYAITWWENTDGTGTVWTKHTVDGSFGANSIYAVDVDNDGDVDVLGAAPIADDITWWNVIGYSATGTLESSILDAGTVGFWGFFTSSEEEPAGTSLGFQFRSSDDSANMGAWSDTVFATSASLSGILADSTDFLQYRVILQTTDYKNTPVLNDVTFDYTIYVNIGDSNANEVTGWGLAPAANPSFGNFAVQVSVPQSGMVDLVLYDITGRVITRYSEELPGGLHSVFFNNLASGVYFCTMHAGDFTATERVVLLK